MALTCLSTFGIVLLAIPEANSKLKLVSQIVINGPFFLMNNQLVSVPLPYTQAKYFNGVYALHENTLFKLNSTLNYTFPFKVDSFAISELGQIATNGSHLYIFRDSIGAMLPLNPMELIIDLFLDNNLLYIAFPTRVRVYRNLTLIQDYSPLQPLKITLWKNQLVVASKSNCIIFKGLERKILPENCLEVMADEFLFVRGAEAVNVFRG